ncbi:DUF3238 domain-containing protein [Pseudobacillus badius]|uniref:DUF3238 domain-containing protein n=1 Tax=Bacillus badius TaxID=1455 RepID=UPI003D34A78D
MIRIANKDIFLHLKALPFVHELQPDAPNIDYKFTIKITRSGIMRLTRKHDGFPAYELWKKIDGQSPKKCGLDFLGLVILHFY